MLETDVIGRIRHSLLQQRPHFISQAMRLLGWTQRQMSEAIEAGEVELWTTPLGKWFPRAEMMAKALEIWPLYVNRRGALGRCISYSLIEPPCLLPQARDRCGTDTLVCAPAEAGRP